MLSEGKTSPEKRKKLPEVSDGNKDSKEDQQNVSKISIKQNYFPGKHVEIANMRLGQIPITKFCTIVSA